MLYFLLIVNLITTYSLIVYFLLVFGLFNTTFKTILELSLLLTIIFVSILLLRKIRSLNFSALFKQNILIYLLVGVVISIFAFLYTHPFEEFLGGRDPGVYISIAENIAKNETIKATLPILETATKNNEVSNFFHFEPNRPPEIGHKGYYFLGYYITNPEKGELTPQFFHLPSTIASFWIEIFGTKNIIYFMPTLFVMISILLFGFIKEMTKNSTIALMGLILWLTSPAILFWSRSFNSESFAVFFILSLILNAFMYLKTRNILFALFAIFSLLASFLSRGDPFVYILVIFVLIALVKSWRAGLLITIILSLAFYLGFTAVIADTYPYFSFHSTLVVKIPGYSQKLFYELRNILPLFLSIGIFISGIIFMVIGKSSLVQKALGTLPKIYTKYSIYLAIIMFAFLFLIYYFFDLLQIFPFLYDISLASNKANLIKLGWYIGGKAGWISLIAGSFLLIQIALNKMRVDKKYLLLLIFILIELVFSLFFINNSLITRDQPWWSRRYLVPTILLIPVSFIFIWEGLKTNKVIKPFLIFLLFSSILISNFYYARPIIATQKYEGSYNFMQTLDSCFKEKTSSVIIFDTSYNPSDPKTRLEYLAGNFFGQSLWIYYDRIVFYPKDRIDPNLLLDKINRSAAQNKKTYIVNPSEKLLSKSRNFKEVCNTQFDSEMIGWGAVFGKKYGISDLKLTPESVVEIHLPVKIFEFQR